MRGKQSATAGPGGSPFAALASMASERARQAISDGRLAEALEWLSKAPDEEPARTMKAFAGFRRAGELVAGGAWLEAESLLAPAPRNSRFPAHLMDERQRLIRVHRTGAKPMSAETIGSSCQRCEGGDLYRLATCEHHLNPIPQASKLRSDFLQPLVSSIQVVGAYRPGWDRERTNAMSVLIRRTKERIDPLVIARLGALLSDFVGKHTSLQGRVDAVVAVPTSREREQVRGGGVPTLLAASLRDGLALPAREPIIQIGEHRDHTQAWGRERRDGLRAAWKHTPDKLLVGRSVLLVDDIVTTGTTLGTAAELLLEGGVGEVHAVALLKTELSG